MDVSMEKDATMMDGFFNEWTVGLLLGGMFGSMGGWIDASMDGWLNQ